VEPVLSVNNLSISFGKAPATRVVQDVGFELFPGETLALVGESGSGKTLTALSIMGLLPKAATICTGNILLRGKGGDTIPVLTSSAKQLQAIRGKQVAMIFQEAGNALNPVMTCGRQITETILCHQKCGKSTARKKTISLLKEVQLQDPERIYHAYPHELSGGQKQRVMIAMALSCNPSVILADEPTSALDVTVQKGIIELLRELQQKHRISILFISHDLELVKGFANRVLVMYQGRVVEQKAVDELFTKAEHPYTKGLIQCRPPHGLRLRQLPTVADFLNPEQVVADFFHPDNIISDSERKTHITQMMAGKPFAGVKNLVVRFSGSGWRLSRKITAVDDVSFDVYPGEMLGVVGESGSGKTSLSRAFLRLIEPEKGSIFIGNREITSLNGRQLRANRKFAQIVFQDPYAALNPLKTIGQTLMEPLVIHESKLSNAERKARAIHYLQLVGLRPDYFDRYPHALSGGQRQRIAIARALILAPEFLILDEPVSSLDVSVQAQIINLLTTLRAQMGFTSIFISHDLNLVRSIAGRIIVMKEGRIVEIAEADTLFSKPSSDYTKQLIQALPGYPGNTNSHVS